VNHHHPLPKMEELVALFYSDPATLGMLEEIAAGELPVPYNSLLAHDDHMTVTVESFHGGPVDVDVLERKIEPPRYARKILLRRHADGQVVQFGIVRLSFEYLGAEVQRDIESEQIPLGRTLIEHNVLRKVQLASVWRVRAGDDLARLFQIPAGTTTYGRTALIYCNGKPAVELLEIVTPVATMRG
jgi:chorismate-pyruvate lyase